MNSTQKGDIFEHRVYTLFSNLLENSNLKIQLENKNELHIIPKSSIIGEKVKKYFEWGDAVINDLVIENEKLQVLVECKSYSSSVDRGEILEFIARVNHVGATKGIFVTTSNYQSGAINAARACNIALVRINDNDDIYWDLYRLDSSYPKHVSLGDLLNESSIKPCVIKDGNQYFESLPAYLGYCLNVIPPQIKPKLPFWSDIQIEEKVKEFVNGHKYPVMTDDMLSICAIANNIPIETNSDCGEYLGIYNFLEKKIYISSLLEEDNLIHRKRFTIAHELGHAMLHQEALNEIIKTALDKNFNEYASTPNWMKSLEIQANIFASYLLMPKIPFINVAMEVKSKLGISISEPFYLDRQACNQHLCNMAMMVLSSFFKVSKWAVKIRLKKEKLLIEKDDYKATLLRDIL